MVEVLCGAGWYAVALQGGPIRLQMTVAEVTSVRKEQEGKEREGRNRGVEEEGQTGHGGGRV